jgi:hypothetical protein
MLIANIQETWFFEGFQAFTPSPFDTKCIKTNISREHFWNNTEKEEVKLLQKTLSQCHFCLPQISLDLAPP